MSSPFNNQGRFLPANSSMTMPLTLSLRQLLSSQSTSVTWQAKAVELVYSMVDVPYAFSSSVTIPIYVTVRDCGDIKSMGTCLAVPSCIYCLSHTSFRVLWSENPNKNGIDTEISEADSFEGIANALVSERTHDGQEVRRHLFVNIVPSGAATEGPVNGVCHAGNDMSECSALIFADAVPEPPSVISSGIAAFIPLVALLVGIAVYAAVYIV
jgi:hypothetical protein